MSKGLYFVIVLCLLFACKKTNPNNPATPSNPTTNYYAHYIPNWWNNDTLVGMILDSNQVPAGYDTVYTKTVNDTSFIIHKGVKYYIWCTAWIGEDSFKNNKDTYFNVCINTKPDTIGMPIKLYNNNVAVPYKYLDSHNNTAYQLQRIVLNTEAKYSVFKSYAGQYAGLTKHY
jgi:hypothetical protein